MPSSLPMPEPGLASSSATLSALKPLLANCGITRLADITGLDITGMPVATATRRWLSRGP